MNRRIVSGRTVVVGVILCSVALQGSAGGVRSDFLKLIDRPRVPLAPEITHPVVTEGILCQRFSFASEAGERVPGILMRGSGEGPRPVVIALHGTGGTKESQTGLLTKLAGKGFVAVAIDGRFHGERTSARSGSAEYSQAILRTYRTGKGHPFLFDTVRDVLRLVDYLEMRPDVDPRRVGLIGFSKGGMETYLAAAADPRISVAIPCIGVQSFRWALDNNSWQSRVGTFRAAVDKAAQDEGVSKVDGNFIRKFYDRVAPGIYSEFDGPAMLPLIAPRPLLVINGDSDARTPLPGLMECAAAAQKAYSDASAQDRLILRIQESTGHQVRPAALEEAIAWFVRWLKPVRTAGEH